MLDWLWHKTNSLHVFAELSWNFSQNLLREISQCDCLAKRYELNNVTDTRSSAVISKRATISVQLIHTAKIGTANTNNND